MTANTLYVGHLRLRSKSPLASEVGISARISDALRISSRPSVWHGRVVLVRRLRVRLPERAPAHQMTLAIEREWQHLARRAVEYVHASSASDVVWFAGPIEARLALIARLAGGEDVSAWFWRRLLPLDAQASADDQLVALFSAPWPTLQVSDGEQMRFARIAFAALGSKARAMSVIARLGAEELQRLLPSLTEDEAPARRWPYMTNDVVSAPPWHERALRIACSAIDRLPPERHDPTGACQAGIAVQHGTHPTTGAGRDGIASDWAGLFFILNLLPHGGVRPSGPRDTVAILNAVATWLRIRADEPIYRALTTLYDDGRGPDVADTPTRTLRMACVALTRRPLRRIVARPGRILITRTHLTTVFDVKSVRLDVRKAGLDLDPGWLAHLGRVVRFEYE